MISVQKQLYCHTPLRRRCNYSIPTMIKYASMLIMISYPSLSTQVRMHDQGFMVW